MILNLSLLDRSLAGRRARSLEEVADMARSLQIGLRMQRQGQVG